MMLSRSANLFNLHRRFLLSNTIILNKKNSTIFFYSTTSIHKQDNTRQKIDTDSSKIKSENVKHNNNMRTNQNNNSKINHNTNKHNNNPTNIKNNKNSKTYDEIEVTEIINNYNSNPVKNCWITVDALRSAYQLKLELSLTEYYTAIEACAKCRYITEEDALNALWAYEKLKEKKNPISLYSNMTNIFADFYFAEDMLNLLEDCSKQGYSQYTRTIFSELFDLLEKKNLTWNSLKRIEPYYNTYRKDAVKQGEPLSAKIYITFATQYCKKLESERAIGIIKEMTNDNTIPTDEVCNKLLEVAINVCDSNVLHVLMKWYKNQFKIRLHQGQLNRILLIAANFGDDQLALVVYHMIREGGYELTSMNYMCLIRAMLLKGDLVSAVEVLQAMDQAGIQFQEQQEAIKSEDGTTLSQSSSSLPVFSHNQYASVKSAMIACITGSSQLYVNEGRRKLDILYFSLVQQAQLDKTEKASDSKKNNSSSNTTNTNSRVPRLALDVIIEASGRMGMIDRAFATFQEYVPLFNVVPDINSYNSLLSATSISSITFSSVNAMLTVFQDMESTSETSKNTNVVACSPNDRSFSLLFEAMAYYKDFRVFDEVFEYMHNSNIIPFPRSLRRIAVSLALKNEWERVDKVTKLISDLNSSIYGPNTAIHITTHNNLYNKNGFPLFLDKRLQKIKTSQNNEKVSLDKNSNNANE